HEMVGATGHSWMDEYNRLTAIQFLKNWSERRIARPFIVIAAHESDAIGLEHIESILSFPQAAFLIGQRHRSKKTEAPREVSAHLSRKFIALSGQGARGPRTSEPYARKSE